ncbi:hypothetical protein [Pseudomonas sp.]|uniref:hypothetical protein n=1 Tax=unclassified Pseudomonas TaxID=196821 RepID=UPI0012284C6F|nr:hypothetical protein [Pseudomonas sp.]RZI68298.1 MAG: hypothetical protein EOP13_25725 [Pseudomonas sp.]
MAQAQPEIEAVQEQRPAAPLRRRRKVMIGVGGLLGIVVVGAATIVTMLEQLEMRNASFRPPMTSLERQQLLPPEPVLEVKPQVEGLRYGAAILPDQAASADSATPEQASASAAALLFSAPSSPLGPSPLTTPDPRSGKPTGIAQAIHVHNSAQ